MRTGQNGERRGLRGGWGLRAIGRLCLRGATVLLVLGGAVIEALVRPPKTRLARAQWTHRQCRRVLAKLNVSVVVDGTFPREGALVTNHQGYLDILVLASVAPCVFVSKAEIARWPVIGWMTTTAGTVYVERGKGGSGAAASVRLREAAADDLPVVFFPEGTTSDGDALLPFHGGLLAEARAAGMAVTPGVLRYALDGPRGATVGDEVAYWGDRGMLEHLARFLTLDGLRAWASFVGAPVQFTTDDRKAAAREARAAVLMLAGGALLDSADEAGEDT